MGQKVHPVGFRLGIVKTWNSQWFDEKNFSEKLKEDLPRSLFMCGPFLFTCSDLVCALLIRERA